MLDVQSYSSFSSAAALAHMQAALSDMTRENEEKALLLNEMRHRMKNNLQTIQSLLRLKKNAASQDVKTQLGHIELYIAALNGVDGELLTTGDARPVSLNRYLRRLMDKLKATYACVAETVSFCVNLEEVEVPAKIATNVGLLVNEAVTNSFKHAVPRGAGEISLALKNEDINAVLIIDDDGPGIDGEATAHAGGTLLMKRLAGRFKGNLEYDPLWHGTRYIVKIPLE